MTLSTTDTLIPSQDIRIDRSNIFGHYHYQYSEAGYQEDLNLTKLSNDKVSFNIFSVTNDPGRKVANQL